MHVEKYTRNAVGHLLRHYSREEQHIGNKSVERNRSWENYNLAPVRDLSDIDYYRLRLSKVKCQNRADVKTLCDWIITLPKQPFTEKEEQTFFRHAYQFMEKRYGESNVISAWVHKDEMGQPHLHFCFIPICIDKKKGIEKVAAKEVLTRTELRSIHKDMAIYMEKRFWRDIGILNGATAGGNRSVAELKENEVRAQLEVLEAVKKQSLMECVQAIKNRPQIVAIVTKAIRIAMGEEAEQGRMAKERRFERCR